MIWIALTAITMVATIWYLTRAPEMNWDDDKNTLAAPLDQDDHLREQEGVSVYWIVANKETFRGREVRKGAILASNPDMALDKWKEQNGDFWFIEIITTNYDKADKKIFNS